MGGGRRVLLQLVLHGWCHVHGGTTKSVRGLRDVQCFQAAVDRTVRVLGVEILRALVGNEDFLDACRQHERLERRACSPHQDR